LPNSEDALFPKETERWIDEVKECTIRTDADPATRAILIMVNFIISLAKSIKVSSDRTGSLFAKELCIDA